jgi:threonine synthase
VNYVRGLECLRCGTVYPPAPMFGGCPRCASSERTSNLSVIYDLPALSRIFSMTSVRSRPWNMWRYRELLPVDQDEHIVSLLEGGTSLLDWSETSSAWGLKAPLYAKDETRNPTWSFKDRLGSVAVSKALDFGFSTIADSSTGNQGASSAAHAAKAQLPAVIFTNQGAPSAMKRLMGAFGARLVATHRPQERRLLLQQCVEVLGWYPMCNYVYPPVGSNPYGVEGYKTIAFELCEQLGFRVPDVVVFPTDYGDGIRGMWKGYSEFKRLGLVDGIPRFVAVERFGPLENALAKKLDTFEEVPVKGTIALSIATPISTYQALQTLRESGGGAVSVEEEEILQAQDEIAERQGCFLEASSAAGIAGLKKALGRGIIRPDETVICVLTSTGLKDPGPPANTAHRIPTVAPDLEELKKALKESYGFEIP